VDVMAVSTTMHDVVLVSRGPISSLCAQYYLESCPLLGLVMIDPIPLDHTTEENDVDESTYDIDDFNSIPTVMKNWIDFWDHQIQYGNSRVATRPLLLESNGAVPILVMTTSSSSSSSSSSPSSSSSSLWWNEASHQVAQRHSDIDLDVIVPVIELTSLSSQPEDQATEVLEVLDNWIDEIL
jgi:hypothetical protein